MFSDVAVSHVADGHAMHAIRSRLAGAAASRSLTEDRPSAGTSVSHVADGHAMHAIRIEGRRGSKHSSLRLALSIAPPEAASLPVALLYPGVCSGLRGDL